MHDETQPGVTDLGPSRANNTRAASANGLMKEEGQAALVAETSAPSFHAVLNFLHAPITAIQTWQEKTARTTNMTFKDLQL
jgi:hypothetical protein